MNGAHYHLIVNHLPIIFPLVGAIVLTTGLIAKSEAVKRTAFMIFILGAVAAILAMYTGDGAEDVVKQIEGVSKDYIHTHEHIAETFAILTYALGALSIFGLYASWKKSTYAHMIALLTLAFTVVVLFYAQKTGTTGGEIRHTEIREAVAGTASSNNNTDKKEDD